MSLSLLSAFTHAQNALLQMMKKISNICHQGEVAITNFLVMFVGVEFTREALKPEIACSRLSNSGKDAKLKGTRKVFFHVRPFSIPADSSSRV